MREGGRGREVRGGVEWRNGSPWRDITVCTHVTTCIYLMPLCFRKRRCPWQYRYPSSLRAMLYIRHMKRYSPWQRQQKQTFWKCLDQQVTRQMTYHVTNFQMPSGKHTIRHLTRPHAKPRTKTWRRTQMQ